MTSPRLAVSIERRRYILDGDPSGRGGGHRFGSARPGKSEFPADWTDDEIIATIEEVANDPASQRRASVGDIAVEATRRSVAIRVIIRRGIKWTGYPTDRPRNQ